MKSLKSVLSLCMAVCMMLALCAVPALAADTYTYELIGENIILPHKTEVIKLQYKLNKSTYKDGVFSKVETVTAAWTITEAAEDICKYVEVNPEKGTLYVNCDEGALGQTFKLNAKSGGVTTSINVKIADKHYFEDFENEGEIGSSVTSALFGESNNKAAVIANGEGKAAKAAGGGNNNEDIESVDLVVELPEGFEPINLNVETDILQTTTIKEVVEKDQKTGVEKTVIKQVLDSQGTNLLSLNYKDNYHYVKLTVDSHGFAYNGNTRGDDARYGIHYNPDSEYSVDGNAYKPIIYDKWMPVKFKISNQANYQKLIALKAANDSTGKFNSIWDHYATIYGEKVDGVRAILKTNNLTKMAFGTNVDNIKIYSGEITEYPFECLGIKGPRKFLRPLPGEVAVNKGYSLYNKLSDVKIPENITWSLLNAPSGISLIDGDTAEPKVLIAGNADNKDFVLQAFAEGKLVAVCDMAVNAKLSGWSQPYNTQSHYYDNFDLLYGLHNNYKADEILNPVYSGYWSMLGLNYSTAQPGSKYSNANPCYIRQEANGNLYAQATGLLDYTTNDYATGANGKVHSSLVIENYNGTWDGSTTSVYTMEAKMMCESEMIKNAVEHWTVFSNGANGKAIDIRYAQNADGTTTIYRYWRMPENLERSKYEVIAVKPSDEWFDFRVTMNTATKKYSVWIDDVLVVDSAAVTYPDFSFSVLRGSIGISVDDIIYYTGEKYTDDLNVGDNFTILADGAEVSNGYVWPEANEKASAAVALMCDAKDYEGKSLIVAIYDAEGKLADVKIEEVSKSEAGISVATAELEAAVTANSSFKAFLLDPKTLIPLK